MYVIDCRSESPDIYAADVDRLQKKFRVDDHSGLDDRYLPNETIDSVYTDEYLVNHIRKIKDVYIFDSMGDMYDFRNGYVGDQPDQVKSAIGSYIRSTDIH